MIHIILEENRWEFKLFWSLAVNLFEIKLWCFEKTENYKNSIHVGISIFKGSVLE